MFPSSEFRLAVAYLLFLKAVIHLFLRNGRGDLPLEPLLSGRSPSYLRSGVHVLFVTPLLAFAAVPELLRDLQMLLPAWAQWIQIVPAAGSLLLPMWAWRGLTAAEKEAEVDWDGLAAYGPFRRVRYPFEAGDVLFYGSLALLSGNGWAIGSAAVATLLLRYGVLPRCERARQEKWGQPYADYAATVGLLTPILGVVAQRQYTVPKRFGMAPIVALFTVFGVLFGVMRYWEAGAIYYLFVASEIVAICLGQILFGSTPRGISAMTGAALLPFWVWVSEQMHRQLGFVPDNYLPALYGMLMAFGALLGYCIGALAAGFFLVTDLLESWWHAPPGPSTSSPDGSCIDKAT